MKINLGVFFGGKSTEHEVSIITAIQAIENMNRDKYNIIPVYISKENKMYCGKLVDKIEEYKNIDNVIKNSKEVVLVQKNNKVCLMKVNKSLFENAMYDYIDVAFPIVHGTNVEDGTLQGYLKMFNIPYVGSDVVSSANGMDKYFCKVILKESGIPVLDCKCFTSSEYYENENKIIKELKSKFKFPMIVKPVNLGSSVGIKIAKDQKGLKEAIENAFMFANKILVEKAVLNLKEVNCSVVGDYENQEASECEEPIKNDEILSYEDKYMSGGKGTKGSMNEGVLKLPADISKKTRKEIQELAKKTFKALGCSGVIRIDFIIDKDTDELFVNEVNTIPGSLSFHLWREAGVDYKDLLDKLVDLALKRDREEKNINFSFDTNLLSRDFSNLKGAKIK